MKKILNYFSVNYKMKIYISFILILFLTPFIINKAYCIDNNDFIIIEHIGLSDSNIPPLVFSIKVVSLIDSNFKLPFKSFNSVKFPERIIIDSNNYSIFKKIIFDNYKEYYQKCRKIGFRSIRVAIYENSKLNLQYYVTEDDAVIGYLKKIIYQLNDKNVDEKILKSVKSFYSRFTPGYE